MHLQRLVIVVVVVVAGLDVAHPAASSLTQGGVECGENPMQAIQIMAQKTGKFLQV